MICTYDGCNANEESKAAIRLAAQEASSGITGPQLAILAADEDLNQQDREEGGGISDLVGSLFRDSPKIPPSLVQALRKQHACTVRHGQLFGKPQSSPEFSPLVGGPRRDPVITEEYTMRNVRVDPFVLSGNTMTSSSSKACRHAVGEASAFSGNDKNLTPREEGGAAHRLMFEGYTCVKTLADAQDNLASSQMQF